MVAQQRLEGCANKQKNATNCWQHRKLGEAWTGSLLESSGSCPCDIGIPLFPLFSSLFHQGWCTGKTQRDGMEREAGGGLGMGNTCKSMADSCHCMAKNHYNVVISLQLIKINGKKKHNRVQSTEYQPEHTYTKQKFVSHFSFVKNLH